MYDVREEGRTEIQEEDIRLNLLPAILFDGVENELDQTILNEYGHNLTLYRHFLKNGDAEPQIYRSRHIFGLLLLLVRKGFHDRDNDVQDLLAVGHDVLDAFEGAHDDADQAEESVDLGWFGSVE